MRVREAIAEADKLRLNTMPDEQKAELLRALDGELAEMMAADDPVQPPYPPSHAPHYVPLPVEEPEEETEEEEEPVKTWPTDQLWPEENPVLLLPFPYDGVYIKYLCAQIDRYNMETDAYQMDMLEYNAQMAEARAWWRRSHRPLRAPNWKVM